MKLGGQRKDLGLGTDEEKVNMGKSNFVILLILWFPNAVNLFYLKLPSALPKKQ